MRQSVAFIKDRFHALKQISMLDPKVALEGGWTSVAIEEELVKLKKELAEERAQLKHALDSAGQLNLNRRSRNGAVRTLSADHVSGHGSESKGQADNGDEAFQRCLHTGRGCSAVPCILQE